MPYNVIIGRDEADKKRFGDKGLIFLGKGYVKMGQYTSLSNPIYLDVARSHVVLVGGKRGSGKSYSLGVIAEELTLLPAEERKNISGLIFDTMGIFWTMKFENEKERELLDEWGLKPKKTDVKIFIPFGYYEEYEKRGIPVEEKFSINPGEFEAEDWIITFNLNLTEPTAVLIERTVTKLRELGGYSLESLISAIKEDKTSSQEVKNSAIGLFEAASSWKVFSEQATPMENLIEAGKTSVLDLSILISRSF